eukprot:TRINITY_DN2476_c0_g1_i1.p1 TRINITY_DN2476_c0_g1~~TRINITY_DN2476_c0_g1_i1.p1  ORF type:complete len:568 (-),score=165.08 TRINITY_DN2476_c0_g1_i1:45-1748(-)
MSTVFISEGLLKASYSHVDANAEVLEKFRELLSKKEEASALLHALCVEHGVTVSASVLIQVVSEFVKKTFEDSDTELKAQEAAAAPAKSSGKGKGYNFKENDNLNALFQRRAQFKADKFNKSIDALLLVSHLLSFSDVFEKADAATYSCINQSQLNGLLGLFTEDNSIADVTAHANVWRHVVDICAKLAANPNLLVVLRPKVGKLPQWIRAQAPLFDRLDQVRSQLAHVGQSVDESVEEAFQKISSDIDTIRANVKDFEKTVVDLNLESAEEKYDGPANGAADEKKEDPKDVERRSLMEFLRGMQFESVDLSKEPFRFSSEVSESASAAPDKKRLMRIKKELAILAHALPDGIFVRVNEERPDILKVLITGPADTPYQNGVFIFDLFLPVDFPAKPPKMRLLTTGTGYRFNPNLYTDGYVCLSLLGTWQGPGWDPENSTLLQLVVSVQAMILCEEPYCNEPGWYGSVGSTASKSYSKQLRKASALYAMLWHLNGEHPVPQCFQKVVSGHFYMNREEIKAQLQAWETLNSQVAGESHCYGGEMNLAQDWDTTKASLETLLTELKNPTQ